MPIRVITKEARYIHELSLTLEHSMSISSPAAPGLTVADTTICISDGGINEGHTHALHPQEASYQNFLGTQPPIFNKAEKPLDADA